MPCKSYIFRVQCYNWKWGNGLFAMVGKLYRKSHSLVPDRIMLGSRGHEGAEGVSARLAPAECLSGGCRKTIANQYIITAEKIAHVFLVPYQWLGE